MSGLVPDFLEAGAGPPVVLVPSSVSGARQWRRLMDELKDRFHLRSVSLYGYGKTPAWPDGRRQTIADQVALVAAAVPAGDQPVTLIGHSFGGWVAMRAAASLGPRVSRLVLFEPNPFHFLRQAGRTEAYAEAMDVRDWVKRHGGAGDWRAVAERFAEYWAGAGAWAAMPAERQAAFAAAMHSNFHEWDTFEGEDTTLPELKALLPERTLVMSSKEAPRPTREIVELMRAECPTWRFAQVAEGGHMAPLTRPDLVNPIIADFLEGIDP